MNIRSSCAIAVVLLSACGEEEEPSAHEDAAPAIGAAWEPLAADKSFEDKSLDEWLVEWKRWAFSQTDCDSPTYDPDGSQCGLYQDRDGPVFFMDFSADETKRTECRVPRGKAIVVPLATVWQDNVGMEEPYTDEELEKIVTKSFDSMRDFEIEADGVSYEERATDYAVAPRPFTFDLPPTPNWVSCNGWGEIGGLQDERGWIAGYLMVFPPPEPGRHELRYAGVTTYEEDEYYLGVTTSFVVD
jgi:hypothetical protein